MSSSPDASFPHEKPAVLFTAKAQVERSSSQEPRARTSDRSWLATAWYRLVQQGVLQLQLVSGGIRATGQEEFPDSGGVLLISNHLSYYDVFVLGLLLRRKLNYVARSSLFTPFLAPLIRSFGGFPIQRDGLGAEGLKETLKKLRSGGIVTFFPEGTRSGDGRLGELKPGIAVLAARAGVPVVAAGIEGTFECWPRGRTLPHAHSIRIHYGSPIWPDQLKGMSSEQVLALLQETLRTSSQTAKDCLSRDLGLASS